jgi:hypothetical protein
MSDMTYTGNDDDFWEQWEKMTLHDQGMWALQHVLIAYVNKERDKERPVKLNHAVAVALGDLLDELRASVPVLETPAEAVFCDHSQWRECAATLEMVRDLSDKALNYTAAYDLANDLAAILAGSDDAIPGALVEPVPAPTGIDPSELMRALHANLTPLAHVEVTDRRPYGMSEDTIQVWPITGVRSVVNHLALKSAPVPAPSENLNKGEEMIALFDEVKLDGFTIQFKDKEQMEANKTADNSPTPWSEKTPLAESVKRWKSQGQTATLLLVYGVVLAMTGGPNHFARTVIDQHVIVGSNPVRVVSMKISNE